MANVLNRATKQYLESVDTPMYAVEEWVINPDLSLVLELAPKYWKIIGDTVEAMTVEEQAEYDLANPVVEVKNRLTEDQMPAYMVEGIAVSVMHMTANFSSAAKNAKNFNLDCGASTQTYHIVRNAVILRGSAKAKLAESGAQLVVKVNGVNAATLDPKETKKKLHVLLTEGDEVSVYATGGKVTNPSVEIEFAWRD